MQDFLSYAIPAALIATIAILFAGLFVMTRGRVADSKRSNRLMRLRVVMQLLVVGLLILAVLFGL